MSADWIDTARCDEGIAIRRNPRNGFVCVEVDFWADPEKRAPDGKHLRGEWAKKAFRGMPDWAIEQEYLRSYTARRGRKVFDCFDEMAHVRVFTISETWTRYVAVDHGLDNPCAALWIAVDTKGDYYCYREHYRRDQTVYQNAIQIVNAMHADPKMRTSWIDPSTQRRMDNAKTTLLQEYRKWGLPVIPADNAVEAGLMLVLERMQASLARWSLDRGRVHDYLKARGYSLDECSGLAAQPAVWISPLCPNLVTEIKHLRHGDDQAEREAKGKEMREGFTLGDDHLIDCLRYVVNGRAKHVFVGPKLAPVGTVAREIQNAELDATSNTEIVCE